jgi:AIPR protein
MSIIHISQIKNRLNIFNGIIDMKDQAASASNNDDMFTSRALAAYSIFHLSGCSTQAAANSVTDGSNDNGIDAVFHHEAEAKLYIVQSKWIKDGKGEPDNGSVKKFVAGIRDLLNFDIDRFNGKIAQRQTEIATALETPGTQVIAILVHTGTSDLSDISKRDMQDLLNDVNDAGDVLSWEHINQQALHRSLTEDLNSPITASVSIRYWGKVQEPRIAYYGQVSAIELANLWITHKDKLVAKNLRGSLGDTDVNLEVRESLRNHPELFWYYNNGITAIASDVKKLVIGGGSHDIGVFQCEDIYIVNGAQTVSTIGKYVATLPQGSDDLVKLESCFVPFRVVSLEEGGSDFGAEITRTNNRQNKIESRDFVSQDHEQNRLKNELAIDGIQYQVVRTFDVARGEKTFDLVDATAALTCANGDIGLIVTLKAQIGRLWDDITKAPYKILFNPTVSSLYLWRCVQTQRLIDAAIAETVPKYRKPRERKIISYGNRLISGLIFKRLPINLFDDPKFAFDTIITSELVVSLSNDITPKLILYVQRFFSNSMIPALFKNSTKCREIYQSRQLTEVD